MTGLDPDLDVISIRRDPAAPRVQFQYQAWVAPVSDDEVAPAAQYEGGGPLRVCFSQRLGERL